MAAPPRFRPRVSPLPPAVHVPGLLAAWGGRRAPVVLDSAGGAPAHWSLFAFDPLRDQDAPTDWRGVRDLARSLVGRGEAPGPFQGGFLGALAYDLGVEGEDLDLPADPWGTPPVVGGLYTDFAFLDHRRGEAWLVLGEDPGDDRPPVEQRRAALLERLLDPLLDPLPDPLTGPSREGDPPRAGGVGPLVRHVPPALHRARVERARELIAAGEIYQANLAHRFTRVTRGHPADLYRSLRTTNPGPYCAYMAWGDGGRPAGAILSSSPELLLECDGRALRTRPIKGTVGRGATPRADARARARLLASPKERAELAMIVDLARNDLSRVARGVGVGVGGFPTCESYAAVHHLAASVTGTLRAGLDGGDALAALFPGGSVTGAPKLRSMEAIAELEGEGRGFFTGSLGFLDRRGHGRFNILIRTLVWRPAEQPPEGESEGDLPGEVSFHVGGGITWASDPAAEERETLYKGAALAAALRPPGLRRPTTVRAVSVAPGPPPASCYPVLPVD